jgi:hypothetical protein
VREKFRWAAARVAIVGDRWEFRTRHRFIIDMAFAAGHENEGAAEADFITNGDFAFDERAVSAAAQDAGANFNFTR